MLLESDEEGLAALLKTFKESVLHLHTNFLIHAVHSWREFWALPSYQSKWLLEDRTLSTHVDHDHVSWTFSNECSSLASFFEDTEEDCRHFQVRFI